MKELIFITSFFIAISSFSQDIKEKKYHSYGVKEGRFEYHLLKRDYFKDSLKHKISFESLVRKSRGNILKRLKGKWIFKDTKCWGCVKTIIKNNTKDTKERFKRYLEISNDSLFCILFEFKN